LVVALRSIVDNGYLHVRNLDRKVYAKLGFKVLCVTNHPIPNWTLPSVVEARKDAKHLIPKDIPVLTKQYLDKLFDDNLKIGSRKLEKLWRRICYRRKQLLEEDNHCIVEDNELWKSHVTDAFKHTIH
jgi:hypothetical protein